ncbi:MAG: 4Fe-4S binding protein [Candidatus Kapaibacteriota bacterium]|jgi:ferredoxin
MALYITSDCINCGRCERECPVYAITEGIDLFEIDPKVCVECIGYNDEPQCAIVCPADCCIKIDFTS